jgi:hypothetical protein
MAQTATEKKKKEFNRSRNFRPAVRCVTAFCLQEIGIRLLRPPSVCLGKRPTLFTQVAVLELHFKAIFTYISRSETNVPVCVEY